MRARVDPTATVDPAAHVGPECDIGAGVVVAPGAFLQGSVLLADGVLVGPNATFIGRGFDPASLDPGHRAEPIVVHAGASIGANATLLGGVTVHERAVIGAGAVVTRDVPAHAIVVGNPARIVGYATAPDEPTSQPIVASVTVDDDFPVRIGDAELLLLPSVLDLRGALSYAEHPTHLPFVPARCFLVYDVPNREVRGEHAHRRCDELLICVSGEVAVAVDDGRDHGEVVLDRRDVALRLPPLVWSRQYRYSPDAVLLALASDPYDAEDYVRNYQEFRALVGGSGAARD